MHLIDGVVRRICEWKGKIMLTGGKEVLVKYVVQAIPAYVIYVFKLPKKVVKESLMQYRILVVG